MVHYAQPCAHLPHLTILIASPHLGVCRNRGIAMLSSWEHRDEDTIKASAQETVRGAAGRFNAGGGPSRRSMARSILLY